MNTSIQNTLVKNAILATLSKMQDGIGQLDTVLIAATFRDEKQEGINSKILAVHKALADLQQEIGYATEKA